MNTLTRALLAAPLIAACLAPDVRSQAVVDLTPWQTPLRDQGSRTTCITFSAVAAVEARYRRLGQTIDLSEEFVNYMRKMFWLEPNWNSISSHGADRTENQLGATGGGNGTAVLEWMTDGLAAPREQYFPYTSAGFTLPHAWNSTHYQSQRNVNTWNLDPDNLPRAALRAPGYYYPTGFQRINQPNNAAMIEGALQNGYEVVWDFYVRGDRNDPIWHASNAGGSGGHSMLIVGYDRSSPNTNDHHFIVKNSWGPTTNPGGYTWIGYDYIQYGYSAGIVTSAAPTPKAWPELGLIGRRNICFDGWPGTLDIYHLPGINQTHLNNLANGLIDRRVGTFYDHNGVAHRVNGMAYDKTMHFWIKGGSKNMRYDEQRETPTVGRSFVYTLVDTYSGHMAGRHHDNPGLVANPPYGGYARVPSTINANDGFLSPATPTYPSTMPEQYLGAWSLHAGDVALAVRFSHRNDNLLTVQQQQTHAALAGTVVLSSGALQSVVGRVNKQSPRTIELTFVHSNYGLIEIEGWMLNWQRGVAAGLAHVGTSPYEAFYLVRRDDFTPGTSTTFGSACGPTNYAPYHFVQGIPEVNHPIKFRAPNVAPSSVVVLALGLSNQQTTAGGPLPQSLTALGMPGCNLLVDPMITEAVVTGSGGANIEHTYTQTALLGQHLYSQYFVLMPGANALGIVSSNAVDTVLGGTF
tara:strand:+ start:222 stop:2294 length:2073 start_codon:yes stop_codon:yes gene_type:complete